MSADLRAEYERLLVALHREMRAGRGDEVTADELREVMALQWSKLDADERRRLDELSEDLYFIEESPKTQAEEARPHSIPEELKRAFRSGDDTRALSLLRRTELIPIDVASYIYGRCWERRGYHLASTCFYDFAYEWAGKDSYAIMALHSLVEGGQLHEAMARAAKIEHDETATSGLILQAASVFYRSRLHLTDAERKEIYKRIIALVERAGDDFDVVDSVRSSALVTAGFCHAHLSHPDDALRMFNRAVQIKETDTGLVARAMFLLSADRRAASNDFRRAMELHTTLIWPYLYLAHEALLDQRYQDAQALCELGLALVRTPEPLRARLWEWAAISAIHLGRPTGQVRERFSMALTEDPLDPVIRHNALLFDTEVPSAGGWRIEAMDPAEAQRRLEQSLQQQAA